MESDRASAAYPEMSQGSDGSSHCRRISSGVISSANTGREYHGKNEASRCSGRVIG